MKGYREWLEKEEKAAEKVESWRSKEERCLPKSCKKKDTDAINCRKQAKNPKKSFRFSHL